MNLIPKRATLAESSSIIPVTRFESTVTIVESPMRTTTPRASKCSSGTTGLSEQLATTSAIDAIVNAFIMDLLFVIGMECVGAFVDCIHERARCEELGECN